jgi:hypothetical protein
VGLAGFMVITLALARIRSADILYLPLPVLYLFPPATLVVGLKPFLVFSFFPPKGGLTLW